MSDNEGGAAPEGGEGKRESATVVCFDRWEASVQDDETTTTTLSLAVSFLRWAAAGPEPITIRLRDQVGFKRIVSKEKLCVFLFMPGSLGPTSREGRKHPLPFDLLFFAASQHIRSHFQTLMVFRLIINFASGWRRDLLQDQEDYQNGQGLWHLCATKGNPNQLASIPPRRRPSHARANSKDAWDGRSRPNWCHAWANWRIPLDSDDSYAPIEWIPFGNSLYGWCILFLKRPGLSWSLLTVNASNRYIRVRRIFLTYIIPFWMHVESTCIPMKNPLP